MDGQTSPTASTGGDILVQLQAQLQVQQEHLLRQEQVVNAMQLQLNESLTRMQRADEERNLALKLAARKTEDLIDSKGVGQPFKFSGKSDQDFSGTTSSRPS